MVEVSLVDRKNPNLTLLRDGGSFTCRLKFCPNVALASDDGSDTCRLNLCPNLTLLKEMVEVLWVY